MVTLHPVRTTRRKQLDDGVGMICIACVELNLCVQTASYFGTLYDALHALNEALGKLDVNS